MLINLEWVAKNMIEEPMHLCKDVNVTFFTMGWAAAHRCLMMNESSHFLYLYFTYVYPPLPVVEIIL
jgi:hypothetical protein